MSSPITEMGRHGELLTFSLTLNVSEMLPGRKGLSCLTGLREVYTVVWDIGKKKKKVVVEGRPILSFIPRQNQEHKNGEKLLNNQQ